MKTITCTLFCFIFLIGHAQKEIELNTNGIVLPRLSKADKAAISPVEGQLFYNTDTKSLMLYTEGRWERIQSTTVSVTDIDGNSYDVIQIAGLNWTVQNLRTTRFNDGTPIMRDAGGSFRNKEITVKSGGSTPFYTYYQNDSITYAATYGALYNHCAVAAGNLCPTGWRVPSETDWDALILSLGGASVAGGALKETGTANWNAPNTGATNSSGFTGLPGGIYDAIAPPANQYTSLGAEGYYWSSNVLSNNNQLASFRRLSFDDTNFLYEAFSVSDTGISVRCVFP